MVWTNKKYSDSLSIIVDLSLSYIDITILKSTTLEFSRSIYIENEKYRQAFIDSKTSPETIEKVSKETSKAIVEEIQNALTSCKSINDSTSVETIHVIGGGNIAANISYALEKLTEVQTNRVQPQNFIKSHLPNIFITEYMATSLGLASRELKQNLIEANLLPESPKIIQRKRLNTKNSLTLMAATVLFVIGFIANHQIHNNKILASLNFVVTPEVLFCRP